MLFQKVITQIAIISENSLVMLGDVIKSPSFQEYLEKGNQNPQLKSILVPSDTLNGKDVTHLKNLPKLDEGK